MRARNPAIAYLCVRLALNHILMKRLYLWLISMLSGVLLALAWPAHGFTPLVFVALFPLFWVEDYILERQQEYDRHQAARKALRISPKLKAYIEHIVQKLPVSKKTDGNKSLPVLNGVPRYNRISGDAPESTLPKRTRYHLFFYSFSAFLVWNVLTTWWIWNSTPAAVLAFVLNALLMALVFTLFHYSCRHFFKKGMRWILLFIYWLGFEYFHHNWDVSWPWLTLGNAFAPRPQWVQWYEITGTLGGSLWILGCNVALLYWFKAWRAQKRGMPIHSENRLCLNLRGKLLLFCGLVIVYDLIAQLAGGGTYTSDYSHQLSLSCLPLSLQLSLIAEAAGEAIARIRFKRGREKQEENHADEGTGGKDPSERPENDGAVGCVAHCEHPVFGGYRRRAIQRCASL